MLGLQTTRRSVRSPWTPIAWPVVVFIIASSVLLPDASSAENRLGGEASTYLQLHADDPVDWYPWGQEAIDKARIEDKPIFLSIGFSACHWCRAMERETFSLEWVARIMNRAFVNIKVDSEERPDLDGIYRLTTQVMTGRGGWPTSVFLTPELQPFFAGTYMPLRDRAGQPGFATVLQTLEHAWTERRIEVEAQAKEAAASVEGQLAIWPEPAATVPPATLAQASFEQFVQRFDDPWGGFGTQPKFPSVPALELTYQFLDRDPRAEDMMRKTLQQMARGAIFDQIGGGFHRYALDQTWRRPRFEKLLSDNAQLLDLYARWHQRDGDAESARIVRQTVAFLERTLHLDGGGFAASVAADNADGEGGFYLWKPADLKAVLGQEDYLWLAKIWGLDVPASFPDEKVLPFLSASLAEQAPHFNLTPKALEANVAPLRETLLRERDKRDRPPLDDQAVTAANGLAIAALAQAGKALEEPAWIALASETARFFLQKAAGESGLRHRVLNGRGDGAALLEDYTGFVHGLLTLHEVTGEASWLQQAERLAREQTERLGATGGGFYQAPKDVLSPFRGIEFRDDAEISGQAAAIVNLVTLHRITQSEVWRDGARQSILAVASPVRRSPGSFPGLSLAIDRYWTTTQSAAKPVDSSPAR